MSSRSSPAASRHLPGDLPIQGDGRATRCFNYIDDAVEGLLVAYEHGETGVYHLGDPREEITIGDLARRIARHYGRTVTLRPSELPKGSPTRRAPDIGKLRALGYEPKVGSTRRSSGRWPGIASRRWRHERPAS
jgi:nucleoside-diphosphate-sugar epimerase